MTLRPFSGRSCTAVSGSSAPTVALSDWMIGACAVTVMVSVSVPTASCAFDALAVAGRQPHRRGVRA